MEETLRVFLDASVLYPVSLRHLLMRLVGDSKLMFVASRFSSDGVLTDTWIVGLATLMRDLEILHGALFARNNIAKVVRDIEDALLTDAAWPSDFGRPDLPARNVQFQDSLP
jgi:hypothetical protein